MPEDYAQRLAKARVVTDQSHPADPASRRSKWPERQRTIQVVGTRGEVALAGTGKQIALQAPVPAGHVVVGYELHRSLKLAVGDRIALVRPDLASLRPPAAAGQPGRHHALDPAGRGATAPASTPARSTPSWPWSAIVPRSGWPACAAKSPRRLPDTQVIEFGRPGVGAGGGPQPRRRRGPRGHAAQSRESCRTAT